MFHLDVDVQKASFCHLEHEAHLGAGVHPLIEALFGMGVYANEVAGRGGRQDGQQDDQLRGGKHVSGRERRVRTVRPSFPRRILQDGGTWRKRGSAGKELHQPRLLYTALRLPRKGLQDSSSRGTNLRKAVRKKKKKKISKVEPGFLRILIKNN